MIVTQMKEGDLTIEQQINETVRKELNVNPESFYGSQSNAKAFRVGLGGSGTELVRAFMYGMYGNQRKY